MAAFSCSQTGTSTITTSGTAIGPYPGTFSASATVTSDGSYPDRYAPFHESFTITSPTGTVTGTKQGTVEFSYFTYIPDCAIGNDFFNSVPYSAVIHTPTGNYQDTGNSDQVYADDYTGGSVCPDNTFHCSVFEESFASSNGVSLIVPTSKDQCKDGGWQNYPQFKNQGECASYVEHNATSTSTGS